MMRTRKGALTVALGAVVALAAGACSSSGGSTGSSTGGGSAPSKGGTLTILGLGPHSGLDPQQTYIGADIMFANRTYSRALVSWSAEENPKLTPDLATDTGDMTDGGKQWSFTLKGTAKWQDGKAVSCDDVKYGISRTFATDVISNGPTYILNYLDIPEDSSGAPIYKGPYKTDAAGEAAYNSAVTCDGEKITFKFKKPWADFNQAIASLAAYNPVRKDKDRGGQGLFDVFSDGPYMLSGTFSADTGGTFVRNPNWSGSEDTLRKAYPDKIVQSLGIQGEQQYQRLIADSGADKSAITFSSAPASLLSQVVAQGSRVSNPVAPYVDYLTPNYQSKAMSQMAVRKAFAQATNRSAYIQANGGSQIMTPTNAICNKALPCYQDSNPFNVPDNGDPTGALATLKAAGITTPVNITVAYRKTNTQDKAFAALKSTWDQGGFNVTLNGITDKYYRTISSPASKTTIDVMWASWGADWPSGSTDIPPLFDSRVNLSAAGSNQDYGYFDNKEVNAAIDQAYTISDSSEREKAWGKIDATIVADGGVVPLVNQKFVFLRGSSVKDYVINNAMGGYPDFAVIAAQ